ncbi:MAG: RNA-binding protein [Desulfuromonadaceae bacterium]|nr:RNA-binding protein [Desulfuromonadaceae bacterium]
MAKELYVGHISEQATEEDLRKLFEIMGVVTSVHLIVDEQTGEFKRCGYVRMLSEVNLNEVVETLDGTYLIDRCIVVSIAKPQKDRPAKTPYVKRKPLANARPAKSETAGTAAARPAPAKNTKSARPVVKENVKTGRSSAAKEAVRKYHPAATKDVSQGERPSSPAKRTGRPIAAKRQGDSPRPPAKGRR